MDKYTNKQTSTKSQTRRTWGLLSITAIILIAHQLFYYNELGREAIDDAYISFRYTQNFIRGHGLVFNAGERVEGYTNFLWTVLIAPFMKMGLPPAPVAIMLGMLSGILTIWLTCRLMRDLQLAPRPWIFAAGLLLAVDGSFALWAVSGMETVFFTMLITAGAYFYLRELRAGNWGLTSGFTFALAAMTRPEGVLVFGLTMLHQTAYRLINERRLFTLKDVIRGAAFLLPYGAYFAWRYRYYGQLLPNTFYVKVSPGGPAAQLMRGWRYLQTYVEMHLTWLVVLVIFVPIIMWLVNRKGKHLLTFISYLILIVIAYTAYIVYVGGDWSVGRFFVPILPAFYVLLVVGIAQMTKFTPRLPAMISYMLFAVFMLAIFAASSLYGERTRFLEPFNAKLANEARITMGKWLRDNVPPDTRIIVDAAGQIPYYSELYALDIFGITDEHTAHLEVEKMGEGTPGHEKIDLDYMVWQKPDYFIIYGNMLDPVDIYDRVVEGDSEWEWTDSPKLHAFLSMYRLK